MHALSFFNSLAVSTPLATRLPKRITRETMIVLRYHYRRKNSRATHGDRSSASMDVFIL